MNCPRCNAELPDTATTCFVCGASTRPAHFSYLPSGVPSWPTTMQANPPYGAGPDLQSAQYVQKEKSPTATKSATAPKKPRLGIPAIIALFIVSILVGGGLTFGILYANGQQLSFGPQPTQPPVQLPTASASPTPGSTPAAQGTQLPTPTAFQTVTNGDVGISMKYPSDWITDPAQKTSDSTSIGIHPQQQIGIFISIERFTSSTSTRFSSANAVNQNNLTQFQNLQGVVNFQAIPASNQQRMVGGVQWDEKDATFSNSNGIAFHLTSIAVQRNKIFYDILYYTPSMYYDEAMQKYFQPMLASFKFLP